MLNRSAILRHPWKLYRALAFAAHAFDRAAFGRVLAMAWDRAKRDAAAEAERARREAEEEAAIAARIVEDDTEEVELPLMEQAIRNLSYLPLHMSASAAEARIRAYYA